MENKEYYAILMAGGVGSRFWPVSTTENPKQFLDILGVGESLIQTTFKRLSKFIPKENILILTHKMYKEKVQKHLPMVKEDQIVLEPEKRNTAPSILLGALKIYNRNKEAKILVAPSDHWIEDQENFIQDVEKAFDYVVENDKLICLGIKPTFPNTGFGYIRYEDADEDLKPVANFTEKPSVKKAQEFLDEGNYLWNAGIFIWKAEYIIACFEKYMPEMYRLFEKGGDVWNKPEEKTFLEQNYGQATNISIDYGIMEKSDNVFVIPASFSWNDLGTWGSLAQELGQDESGNTSVNARILSKDSEGNIIRTERNKIVILQGLKDYIVVENDNALLIIPREEEQEIKNIREEVLEKYGDKLL